MLMHTSDLKQFEKEDLVRAARYLGWSGDDARTKKAEFVDWLSRVTDDQFREAITETCGTPAPHAAPTPVKALSPIEQAILDIVGDISEDKINQMLASNNAELKALIESLMEDRPVKLIVEQQHKTVEIPDGRHACYEQLVKLYFARVNTMLVGPSGSGKSHIVEQIATDLDVKFGAQSCSIGMSESAFSGYLLPLGDSGRFEYVSSTFVDIYENGGIFLIDEIDAADPNLMVFFNMALGNGGFFLPQRNENPRVKRHPDCWIIAAANTYGNGASSMYSGREQQDKALMERFRAGMVEVDYDEKLEQSLYPEELCNWAHDVRSKCKSHQIEQLVSMHFLAAATRRLEQGDDLDAVKESYFAGWSDDERRLAA